MALTEWEMAELRRIEAQLAAESPDLHRTMAGLIPQELTAGRSRADDPEHEPAAEPDSAGSWVRRHGTGMLVALVALAVLILAVIPAPPPSGACGPAHQVAPAAASVPDGAAPCPAEAGLSGG